MPSVAVISTEESRQRALSAGVLAYVVKPLQSQEALEGLLDYLKDFLVSPVRRVALLDPELTVGLPAKLTAATGMDALAHCLEAYCAPAWHPMAEGIAVEGMRLVKEASGVHRYPEPKLLSGSNFCDVGFERDPDTNRVVVMAALVLIDGAYADIQAVLASRRTLPSLAAQASPLKAPLPPPHLASLSP